MPIKNSGSTLCLSRTRGHYTHSRMHAQKVNIKLRQGCIVVIPPSTQNCEGKGWDVRYRALMGAAGEKGFFFF